MKEYSVVPFSFGAGRHGLQEILTAMGREAWVYKGAVSQKTQDGMDDNLLIFEREAQPEEEATVPPKKQSKPLRMRRPR